MLPFRDQVFSEDFAYAQSVRHLLTTGNFKVSERVAPTSITNILWGAAITKIFGFSQANLHLSVVILIPILLFSLYKIFQEVSTNKQRSLIFTLFFLSIPWILQLSYTFLSDIPFLTLELLSSLFYLKGLKTGKSKHLLLGSIFASMAFLTRQLGLIFPIAAILTIILGRESLHQKYKYLSLIAAIPVSTLLLYLFWSSMPGNKTIAQYAVTEEFKNIYTHPQASIWIKNAAMIIHRVLNFTSQALGLFSPLVLLFIIANFKKTANFVRLNRAKFTISTILALSVYTLDMINFRQGYTVGFPLLIYDYESFFPIPWAHIWKILVLVCIPILSFAIYQSCKKLPKISKFGLFTLSSFTLLAILTVIHVASWDQYIVPLLPFILLWIAQFTKKLKLDIKLALVVILILLLDSVQMTKLRYNQSGLIWEKAVTFVINGLSPLEVDANNNFGWYYWFYYEKLAEDSIKSNGGNKAGLDYGFVIEKPEFPKYKIYSTKMMNYTNPDSSNYTVVSIPFKSFFVEQQLHIMKLKYNN